MSESNIRSNKFLGPIKSFLGLIISIIVEIGNLLVNGVKNFIKFVKDDHKYVYLGGSVLYAIALWLGRGYFEPRPENFIYSIFHGLDRTVLMIIFGIGVGFVLLSLVAFITKLSNWENYNNSWAKKDIVARISRYYSYYVGLLFVVVVFDAVILNLVSIASVSISYEKNPSGFLESMFYMTFKGQKILLTGLQTTIQLALGGTLIGFLLACLLVFARIQVLDKRDNDFVKLLKTIGLYFSKTYITVIRGTPMMIQALIIYYSGFAIIRGYMPNAQISELNQIWSFFIAGLITVSLNTTAYLSEVLRGSIEALDKGQNEAARSLGMTNWQTMMKVIFPQAVKNSIPAIGNEFIINIKDSSVLNVISVMDLMYAAKIIVGIYYNDLPVYYMTALIYLVLTYCLSKLLNIIALKINMSPTRGIPSSN